MLQLLSPPLGDAQHANKQWPSIQQHGEPASSSGCSNTPVHWHTPDESKTTAKNHLISDRLQVLPQGWQGEVSLGDRLQQHEWSNSIGSNHEGKWALADVVKQLESCRVLNGASKPCSTCRILTGAEQS